MSPSFTTPGPPYRPKLVHMAKLIGPGGEVSPLCADTPRAINLRRATWTNRAEAVTCKRCLARLDMMSAKVR